MDGISDSKPTERPRRGLRIALWVAQVLLAIAFGMGGFMKLTLPLTELTQKLVWPGALPEPLLRFIGASELAAAFGLLLPAAFRIRPELTPLAAAGLVVIMALAVVFHLSRGEAYMIPVNFVLGVIAAFVAWGRFGPAPIPSRG